MTVLLCSQHLHSVRADEIQGLLEECMVLSFFAKLSKTELYSIDEGTDGILLVARESFTKQRLKEGFELALQTSHTMLHQAADTFNDCVLIDKLCQQAINEGPQLCEEIEQWVHLLRASKSLGKVFEPLEQISHQVEQVGDLVNFLSINRRHLPSFKVLN